MFLFFFSKLNNTSIIFINIFFGQIVLHAWWPTTLFYFLIRVFNGRRRYYNNHVSNVGNLIIYSICIKGWKWMKPKPSFRYMNVERISRFVDRRKTVENNIITVAAVEVRLLLTRVIGPIQQIWFSQEGGYTLFV